MRGFFVFACMASFAAFLAGEPKGPKRSAKVYVRSGAKLDNQIGQAELIIEALKRELGCEKTEELLLYMATQGSQPSDGDVQVVSESDEDGTPKVKCVPYGFWQRFIRDEMRLRYSVMKKQQLFRALQQYAIQRQQGCQTRVARRGKRKGSSLRSSGGAENATKALGLGFMLLQYFVDVVQRLQCRADSALLMAHVRESRAVLENDDSGQWTDDNLPKLIGNAGVRWFLRWRKKYGISKQVIGMKLKVSWRKVKRRVLVLLQNIFRLRRFWELVHPGKTLRWLSLDQKPAWFNNAGHTGTWAFTGGRAPTVKENWRQTRERFTILTTVPWGWRMTDHADNVPLTAMLFKGKKTGQSTKN